MFEIPAGDILKVHSRYNGAPLSRLNEIKARNECENVHKNYKTFAAIYQDEIKISTRSSNTLASNCEPTFLNLCNSTYLLEKENL